MAKREERREDLRRRLVEAAQARIRDGGLSALRARDIAVDAGCALGAIYTAFKDLDELVLHVNSITLARLGARLAQAAKGVAGAGETLAALAAAYLAFAREESTLWRALFEHRMPPGVAVPDWHLAEHAVLIEHIIAPLSALRPQLGGQELAMRARTLFAAVHGIVAISLEERFIGPAPAAVDDELRGFVEAMVDGLAAGS